MKDYRQQVGFDQTKRVPDSVKAIIGEERAKKGWPYLLLHGHRWFLSFEHPFDMMMKVVYDGVPIEITMTEIAGKKLYWVKE